MLTLTQSDEELVSTSTSLPVRHWRAGSSATCTNLDDIAQEIAIALVYNSISHVVMMASPEDLEAFAIGFSLSEGIIVRPSEIYGIELNRCDKGIEVQIEISAERMMLLKAHRRNLTGRTGCGLCGSESLAQAIRPTAQVTPQAIPEANAIQEALSQLGQHQKLQALTGAAHGAAWCDLQGNIQHIQEDIGRHNALDKLIGTLAGNKVNVQTGFVLISSRASYEMVQKASSVGIPTLIAVSAPTALAIDIAKQAQLNLIGFARPGRHVVYTDIMK